MRGPERRIQRPPAKAANPRTRIASSNAYVVCVMLHPYAFVSGMRNTLQAYTAPSAICMRTPAPAINHLLATVPLQTTRSQDTVQLVGYCGRRIASKTSYVY